MVLWLNSFGQYRFTLKCEWFVYRQVMIFLYLDPDNLNTKLTCKCNIFLNLQNTLSDIWCTNIRHEKCISKYDRLLLLMDRWIMSKFTAYIVCTNVLISSGLLSDFLTFLFCIMEWKAWKNSPNSWVPVQSPVFYKMCMILVQLKRLKSD